MALSQLSYSTDTGAERGAIADMLAGLREPGSQDVPMDGSVTGLQWREESESGILYDDLKVRIRRGTTINGAVVALCPAEDGTVVADVCIDGPPVP